MASDLELIFDSDKAKAIADKTNKMLGISKDVPKPIQQTIQRKDNAPKSQENTNQENISLKYLEEAIRARHALSMLDEGPETLTMHQDEDEAMVANSLWQMSRFSGVKTSDTLSENVVPVSEIIGTRPIAGTMAQIDRDMHSKGYFMFREHYPWGITQSYRNKQGDKVYLNIKGNEDELKPGVATWVTWDQLVEIIKQEWRPASQEDRQWYLEHLIDRPMKEGSASGRKTLPARTALIKDDGIADGGEPYTDDEMDLMEGKTTPVKDEPKRWAIRVTFDDDDVIDTDRKSVG
jgi:hypothetical protein